MAPQDRGTDASLIETLAREPWCFDFFQAVRLLELAARRSNAAGSQRALWPVGHDHDPATEVVRFRALLSRTFPPADIVKLVPDETGGGRPPAMQVAFMGLTGPAGVLPESYLDLLQQRVRDKDYALRDFFDLFNHRTISLFYRAWEKYRLRFDFERAQCAARSDDAFTGILESLIGKGTRHQAGRLAVPDSRFLRYAGHFAHFPRSAVVLQAILADHFKVAVEVQQCIGRWLVLEPDQCSRLPSAILPDGQFNQLGMDAVIGSRVWDRQSKFRVRLGPMGYATFSRFLPVNTQSEAGWMDMLIAFIRGYAGLERDFDIQLLLAAAEVPALRLSRGAATDPRLGWNTWLGTRQHVQDRDEARFDVVTPSGVAPVDQV
jgi:type VI secretion system protein ImpH